MAVTADADLEALVDTGTGRGRTSPLRRCLVSRESLPKSQLIRFAADPDGKVLPDIDGKLPGHGFWVQAERKALEQACRRNLFAKAAKQSLTVPADIAGSGRVAAAPPLPGSHRPGAPRAALPSPASRNAAPGCNRAAPACCWRHPTAPPTGGAKMRALAGDLPVVDLFTSAEISQVAESREYDSRRGGARRVRRQDYGGGRAIEGRPPKRMR